MARRVKGEGSWDQVKIGNNTYHRFMATINGRRKAFYGHTKTEAREKYEKYVESHGRTNKRGTMTLSEAAHEMLDMKKSQIKLTTLAAYEGELRFLERHSISRAQVAGLTSKDVQRYLDSLTEEKAVKGIKEQKLIIKMTMDHCLSYGYISEDIMGKVKTPAEIHVKKPTREITFLTTEERHKLEKAAFAKTKKGYPVFQGNAKYAIVFILHTGLRISELIALTWDDYDQVNNRIHISKNAPMVRTEEGYKQILSPPKTKSSIRNVPLDNTALDILAALKKNGKPGQRLIFPSDTGTMLRQRNITRTLESMTKRSGIDKRPTLHDLRHTFASELIRNGADIKTVSKVLGHANVSTTLNIYVHKSDEDIDGIRGLID